MLFMLFCISSKSSCTWNINVNRAIYFR